MKYEVLFECISHIGIIVDARDELEAARIARKQFENDDIKSSIVYEKRIRKTLAIDEARKF